MSQQQPQPAPFNPQGPGQFQPQPAKPKKPWFKKWWVWLLAIIVIIGIGNALGGGGSSDTAAKPAQQVSGGAATTKQDAPASQKAEAPAAPKERLTLEDGWKIDKSNQFAIFVTGYVKNNSDKAIDTYVQITFDALDKEGANVGTCLGNTNTIDANGKWKFKAICSGEVKDINTVRFKEITGF